MTTALRCRVTGSYLDEFAGVGLAPVWKDATLARPLFRPREELDGLARDIGRLLRLLREMPERMFGGSMGDYLDAQGRSPEEIDIILRGSLGHAAAYTRADVIDGPDGPRIIELNVGSEVGGLDYGGIARHMLADPAFARFADSHGLNYVDPATVMADTLRRTAAEIVGVENPRVALIEEVNAGRGCQPLVDVLRAKGLDAWLGELGDLSFRDGKVFAGGGPVDVILRYFCAEHFLDDTLDGDLVDRLVAAHRNGKTAMFTSLDSAAHDSKSVLALLYSDSIWNRLSESERGLVSRYVPPSRFMTAADLPRPARRNLVAKPLFGWSGRGVHFGASADDETWANLLREPRPYVVQERVDPVAELVPVPGSADVAPWLANWGVFVTDDRFCGCFIRAIPATDAGVIAASNPAWRVGVVFDY
jgi:hypothetical protein